MVVLEEVMWEASSEVSMHVCMYQSQIKIIANTALVTQNVCAQFETLSINPLASWL